MTEPILLFKGPYWFLSNFYPATFVWDDITWPHSEAAYQAAKTLDRSHRLLFAQMTNPGTSKREGRLVKCRPDWLEVRDRIMLEVVLAKFKQNPKLRRQLIATGDAYLEEGNHHKDNYWGTCPPGSSNGENMLGHILMAVRDKLRD